MFWCRKNWVAIGAGLLLAATASAQSLQSLSVSPSALFFRNPTGTALTQTVTVTPVSSGATASASTTLTGTWLSVTSTQGSSALTLQVHVDPGTLTSAVYTGRINISAAGFVPVSIPVTLSLIPIVGGANPVPSAVLVVAPDFLNFTAVQGGAGNALPPVSLTNPATENYDWTASSNSSWLTVTPASGHGDGALQVAASAQAQSPGTYNGLITITSGALTAKISVQFTVSANQPASLGLFPPVLTFLATQSNGLTAGSTPAAQYINVNNSGSGSFAWTAQSALNGGASFGGGGNWLSISSTIAQSTTTQSQGQIVVSANPGNLTAGLYSGSVTVTEANVRRSIPVYLQVGKTPVVLSTRELLFTLSQNVVSPTSTAINLSGGQTNIQSYTATATTTSGGNWLSVTPSSGTVSANPTITISAQANAQFTPGLYFGQVVIKAPGSAQESNSVRVVLKVFSPTDTVRLQPSTGGVIGTAPQGPSTTTSTINVNLLGGSASTLVGASLSTISGGNWLQVSPSSSNVSVGSQGAFTVTMSGNGLLPGTYAGKVVFSAANSAVPPVSVPVTLLISSPVRVTGVAPGPLTAVFVNPANGFLSATDLPNPITVEVLDSAGQPVPGTNVVVTSSNGEPPLTLADLGTGFYFGEFHALSAGPLTLTGAATFSGANGIQTVPTFVVTGNLESATSQAGTIFGTGVVSAASYAPGATPVSPGSLASIFGLRIAGTGGAAGLPFPLPSQLGGASVGVGGLPGALIAALPSASGDQVNLQVPFELEGQSTAEVISTVNGAISSAETVVLGNTPSIFSTNETGTGTAAVLHAANFTAVTVANPATRGEQLAIYATGLGPVNQTVATGAAAPGNVTIKSPITVSIGGREAAVAFAGLAPGFAGLYQINVIMPTGAGIGDLPLTMTIAGNPATGSVTIPAK